MLLSLSLVSVALAWAKSNVWALVAGFVTRHVSPSVVAAVKSALAYVHEKVQAALSWVHAKLGGTPPAK